MFSAEVMPNSSVVSVINEDAIEAFYQTAIGNQLFKMAAFYQ